LKQGVSDIAGTVAEISPAADPNSRTFLVKLDLPDAPGLRSGNLAASPCPSAESARSAFPFPP
jgi:hypothetical protein